MNTQFTDEQIKAYAAQFREGDAIWCNGKWRKVFGSWGLRSESPNRYVIRSFDGEVAISGFKEEEDTAYRVTTLDDYELQGGEKIVWLGKINSFLTFGKVYEVDSNARYRDDSGDSLIAKSSLWGVIPHYDQVKDLGKTTITEQVNEVVKNKTEEGGGAVEGNVSDEEFDKLLNEIGNILEPTKNANQLNHVVHYPTAADREEEVLRLKTFEKLTNGVDVKYIVDELKGIMEFALNNGDYNVAIGAIELIKEWEEMR